MFNHLKKKGVLSTYEYKASRETQSAQLTALVSYRPNECNGESGGTRDSHSLWPDASSGLSSSSKGEDKEGITYRS